MQADRPPGYPRPDSRASPGSTVTATAERTGGRVTGSTLRGLLRRLRAGGVIAFPTDTVCGLGCLPTSPAGIRRIYALKGREVRKPLILLASGLGAAESFFAPLPPRVRHVLDALWPGAFTAVLRPARRLPKGVGTVRGVGVRIPDHRGLRSLLRRSGPLATTSANPAGAPPVRSARHALRLWPGRLGVLPGRAGRVPSTLADLTVWPPRILRAGAISRAKLGRIARSASRLQARGRVGYAGSFLKGGS